MSISVKTGSVSPTSRNPSARQIRLATSRGMPVRSATCLGHPPLGRHQHPVDHQQVDGVVGHRPGDLLLGGPRSQGRSAPGPGPSTRAGGRAVGALSRVRRVAPARRPTLGGSDPGGVRSPAVPPHWRRWPTPECTSRRPGVPRPWGRGPSWCPVKAFSRPNAASTRRWTRRSGRPWPGRWPTTWCPPPPPSRWRWCATTTRWPTGPASGGRWSIWEPGRGLNGAVEAGVAHLRDGGVEQVTVAHADLPRATELTSVGRAGAITLVPDRFHNGTNVIALPASAGFRFSYGPGSFARHRAEADRVGLPVAVLDRPDLAWDIDEPGDVVPVGIAPGCRPRDRRSGSPGAASRATGRRPARRGSRHRRAPGAGPGPGGGRPSGRHRVRLRGHPGPLGGGRLPGPPPGAHRRIQGELGPRRRPGRPGGGAGGRVPGRRRHPRRTPGDGGTLRPTGSSSSAGSTASSRTTPTVAGRWPG